MRTYNLLATLALITLPVSVIAATTDTMVGLQDRTPSFAMNDDFYQAGGDVIVKGAVRGDAYTAGGTIHFTQPVGRDLVAAGGTIVIDSKVGDDLRVFGGNVEVNNTVGGDVIVMGGQIVIGKNAVIGGDLFVAGGTVHINGSVRGMTRVIADEALIAGILNGPTEIQTQTAVLNGKLMGEARLASNTIAIGDQALFGGNVRYWRENGPLQFGTKARGKTTYDMALQRKVKVHEKGADGLMPAFFAALSLFSLLTAAVMIGLLVFITKNFFKDTAKFLLKKPFVSFLRGLAYFVGMPIVAVLLAITLIGLPLAAVVTLGFIVSIIFAKALTAIIWVRYIEQRSGKNVHWGNWQIFGLSMAAYVVLKVLMLIPVLGWIACLVLVCMAFGALITMKWEKAQKIL